MNDLVKNVDLLAFCVSSPSHHNVVQAMGQLFARLNIQLKDLTVRAVQDSYQVWGSLAGSWDAIAKSEVLLERAAKQHKWKLELWRPFDDKKPVGLPYSLEATFIEDKSVTMSSLLALFDELAIFVDGIDYHLFPLDDQVHNVVRVQFKLRLPLTLNVQSLRERFYGLCDDLNIDGSLELSQA